MFFRFGVDIEFLSLTVRQSWEEAAFPEVVVYLIQTSRAALTYLSRDRFGMGLCGLVRRVYGRVCALLGCLLYCGAKFVSRKALTFGAGRVTIQTTKISLLIAFTAVLW